MNHERFSRIAGSKPVLVVGALAIAYLAGGLFIVPAVLKWQLPEQAQARLGATLTLGNVYFNPLTLTLEIHDISLRTAREGALLAADKLRADFELSSLFRRAWTFADIQLEQPALRVEFDKQGALNLQPLLTALKQPDQSPNQPPARFLLQRLTLRNGRVDIADQRLKEPLIARISPISLDASDLGTLPSSKGAWQLSARSEAGEVLRAGGALGLQPLALRGTLDLTDVQAGTLARALHTQAQLADVAGTLNLHGEYAASMANGAMAATLDKTELAVAGLALKSAGNSARLESAHLTLGQAQLASGADGMRLTVADPLLKLGATSVVSGATRLQFPAASVSGRQLASMPGKNAGIALDEAALALPELRLKQADRNISVAEPALKVDKLALSPGGDGFQAQADVMALTLKSMAQQGANDNVQAGAAALNVRHLTAQLAGKAPFSTRMAVPRLTVAALTVNNAGKTQPLFSLGQGSSGAEMLTLSLPASGPDVTVTGLSAALQKLVLNNARQPGELAHAGSVHMQGGHVSLAEHRFDLGSLVLADGAADVRFAKDGSLNWTGPATPAAADGLAAPGVAQGKNGRKAPDRSSAVSRTAGDAPWRLTANSIELRNFSAALADARQEPPVMLALNNISGSLAALDTGASAPARLRLEAHTGSGVLNAEGSVSLQDGAGDLNIKANALPLQPLQPYLANVAHLVLTSGALSGAGRLRFGNKDDGPKITYVGSASLDKVALDETGPRQPFLSWGAVTATGMRLALAPNRLEIAQLNIVRPVGELLIAQDQSVNLSRVLRHGQGDAKQKQPAQTTPAPANTGKESDTFPVSVARLRVDNGVLTFADFSQQPQFSTRLHNLDGVMTGLSTAPGSRGQLQFNAAIADYGDARISGTMNPFKPAYATDVRMRFRNVKLNELTPYVVRFAGYRVTAGTLSMDLRYQVKESRLVGDNRFVLEKVQLGEKVDSPTAMDVPLKLALSLLKDENGVINIGVPVTGDLQNPQFSFGAVARRAIGNVLRNIVSAPFRALASLFGGSGEKLDVIDFDPGSADLAPPEQEKLAKLAEALTKRPEVKLLVHPVISPERDAAALRSLAARRQVLARMGAKLAPDEDPGPIDATRPAAQRAIAALYAERYPGTLFKPPATASAAETDAWYAQLLDKVIAAQPLPEDALAQLQRERGMAVQTQLTNGSLPRDRVALAQPEQSAEAREGDVATRLELVPM
jgi:hypothetical protein